MVESETDIWQYGLVKASASSPAAAAAAAAAAGDELGESVWPRGASTYAAGSSAASWKAYEENAFAAT